MSEPRSFAGFFFAALRHKKRGTFWRLRRSKKNTHFPSYYCPFALKITLFKKSYQQFAFLPSNALPVGISPSFPLFFIHPFPTGVWQGWKGAKNTPENNKNKIGKTPKIQTKKSPKRKKCNR